MSFFIPVKGTTDIEKIIFLSHHGSSSSLTSQNQVNHIQTTVSHHKPRLSNNDKLMLTIHSSELLNTTITTHLHHNANRTSMIQNHA